MKEAMNPMHKCGAKCRTNNNQPCRNYAMKNGRCRMHGGKSKGAVTEEGRKRIGAAHIKTGKRTKKALADRKEACKLTREARALLCSVMDEATLQQRVTEGDTDAIIEATEREFGRDEVFHQNLDMDDDDLALFLAN